MKAVIVFAFFIASVSALPSQIELNPGVALNNERIVTDAIASAIEDVSLSIKEAGLDPLYIQRDTGGYALPVPIIFNAEGMVEEFLFQGLSEIVINSISYGVLTSRLRFDISLPLIEATVNKADLNVELFGTKINANAAGRFAIKNIKIVGNIQVNVGIITGISIRSMNLDFSLGGIYSNLNVVVADNNLSAALNSFLGTTIPTTLHQFSAEINELLEIVGLDIANSLL